MRGHTTGIVHFTSDLPGALAFLRDVLDFPVTFQDEDTAVLDNQSVLVRLLKGSQRLMPTILELEAPELDEAVEELVKHPGVSVIEDVRRLSPRRLGARLRAPHGFELLVGRTMDEDEAGIEVPLPTEQGWTDDADQVLRYMVRGAPALFRDLARRRAVKRAEQLLRERGERVVTAELALRGLIQATPRVRYPMLRERFMEAQIDLAPFENEFE